MITGLIVACLSTFSPQASAGSPTPPPRGTPTRLPEFHPELREVPLSLGTFPTRGPTVGARLLTHASESAMQQDLNGDGDQEDSVLQSVEIRTGSLASPGLQEGIQVDQFFTDPEGGPWVLWAVHEGGPLDPLDLNGDGDALDVTLLAYDPREATARNSGLACSRARVSGDLAALVVGEASQGVGDLNGDGRLSFVLFRWDLGAGSAPVNTGIEVQDLQAAHAGFFLFRRSETFAGDLNGDGDGNDRVLFVLDGRTGTVIPTGLALELAPLARGQHSLAFVSEASQGQDLNGDGDQRDSVVHVFDLGTGQLQNLGLALGVPRESSHGGEVRATTAALLDGCAAFHVSELDQGGVDLNGDGDALDEDVLFVHRFDTDETLNVGLSAWNFALTEERIVFQLKEASQGGLDADGDGSGNDFVYHVHTWATGDTWNTGVTVPLALFGSPFEVQGRHVALLGGVQNDTFYVLDTVRRSLRPVDILLSYDTPFRFLPSGLLALKASESAMGQDLDADGDLLDQVLFLYHPGLDTLWNTGAAVTFLLPGFQGFAPFLADEREDGRDHNGDGDALDNVLRVATLRR